MQLSVVIFNTNITFLLNLYYFRSQQTPNERYSNT